MDYDKAYSEIPQMFGTDPVEILRERIDELNPILPVLDLGAGQGRNALFIARHGHTVDAVDRSQVGIEAIAAAAAEEHLKIRTHHREVDEFVPPESPYGAVLLFGILQDMPRESIEMLLRRMKAWTVGGSLVFVRAFRTDDPAYESHAAAGDEIGKHSFKAPDGRIRTYLEPDEILTLFEGYRALHHWEGLGPEHRHGDGPPERHASVEAVFMRREEDV